jgi:hypothetical protein
MNGIEWAMGRAICLQEAKNPLKSVPFSEKNTKQKKWRKWRKGYEGEECQEHLGQQIFVPLPPFGLIPLLWPSISVHFDLGIKRLTDRMCGILGIKI